MTKPNSFWEDFDEEYLVEFLAPVICLGLTLCSIIVELYQVINLCLDFSDEEDDMSAFGLQGFVNISKPGQPT